jgi:hypothetical protein
MHEPGTTPDGTVISFTNCELDQRWNKIVEALSNAEIAPDPLTLAALMRGTSTLMARRGMRPLADEPKRQIGFVLNGERR